VSRETPQEESVVKRTWKYLGVATVLLSLGFFVAWAADHPSLPNVGRGEAYLKSDIWKNVDSLITPLPGLAGEESARASASGPKQAGPVAIPAPSKSGASTLSVSASSIPGMSVHSFLSPQERTANEIRKTIRRLR
jgi:hypothetical protein